MSHVEDSMCDNLQCSYVVQVVVHESLTRVGSSETRHMNAWVFL